jgi:hypothetical protein
MSSARFSPIHLARRWPLSWALSTPSTVGAAKNLSAFREKKIGRGRLLFARSLAIERPGEGRLAPRPVLFRLSDRPFGDKRRLALPAERDEAHHARMRFARDRFRPRILDELRLRLAANEFFRRVSVDAGDVLRRGSGICLLR